MKSIQQKKQDDNKKTIDSAVARVAGAVQVAGSAVSASIPSSTLEVESY